MNANFFGRTSLSMVMLCFLLPNLLTAPRRRRFADDECEDKDSMLIQSGTRCRRRNHGGDDGASGFPREPLRRPCRYPATATPQHWPISRVTRLRTPPIELPHLRVDAQRQRASGGERCFIRLARSTVNFRVQS